MKNNKLYDTVFNPLYLKLFFLVFPLVLESPMLLPLLNSYLKLGLLWGAGFIVYDFFHERKIFEGDLKILLLSFVFFYSITLLLNFRNEFLRMNLIGYFYIVIQMLVMTIPEKNAERLLKMIQLINKVIMTITIIFSLIGFILFLTQYHDSLIYSNKDYVLGFYNGRLVGVYRGITSSTLPIAIMASFMYLGTYYYQNKKISSFAISSILINAIHTGLTNSRTVLIGLGIFVLVSGFFVSLYFLKKIKIKTILISLVISGLLLFLGNTLLNTTNHLMSYAPSWYSENYVYLSELDTETGKPDERPEGPISLDRDVSDNYDKLTGRPAIWKMGIQSFLEKPLFGHGAYSHTESIKLDFSAQLFSHYHSFYVHTLFSTGILGAGVLFAYLLIAAKKIIFYLFDEKNMSSSFYLLIAFLAGIFAYFAITAAAGTNVLYLNRFQEYFFWTYLTLALSLLSIAKTENKKDFANSESLNERNL